jgi:hypothetical protein
MRPHVGAKGEFPHAGPLCGSPVAAVILHLLV